ncbi:MAG TPA: TolC family outer membrane protein, partial [Patescibacteria group bacterium]|nr:TolC family outer membrane protein [Patescibacteria group bacterium]
AAILMAGACHLAQASTLEGEIDGLIDAHPQIQAARKSVQSSTEAISAARSGYLPQVHLNSSVGPNFSANEDRNATYGKSFLHDGNGAGVAVTQRVYDGDLTNSTVDTAIYSKAVSESSLRLTRQNIILEGINAYLDVMRQSALVGLARENEKRLQTQLNLEDERVARGSGMAVDVLAAKHRLQLAKERRVAFEGAQEQALDRYLQVYGHAPDVAGAAEPQPPIDLVPATLAEAVKAAQDDNPSVEVAQRTVTVANERIRTAEAGYYPTLDVVAKSDYARYQNGVTGLSRDYSVLLQMNWELFSGFRTQAQTAQAAYDHGASLDNASQAGRKAGEAVRLAWSQLSTAKERLSLLENAVNLANEVWVARKKMREAGKATVIDVLDSESDITNAQINYVIASYDLRLAAYSLVHAMGRLEVDALDRRGPANSSAPAVK